MSTVVVALPQPAVTAAEAKTSRVFPASDDDTYVDFLLAVAQQSIDGPNGWLGRAIGEQTLELQLKSFAMGCDRHGWISLFYRPATDIVSITYEDLDGETQTVDDANYGLVNNVLMPIPAFAWPSSRAVQIQYTAGQPAVAVPKPLKHAIILSAAELKASGSMSGAVRRETVEGIGSFDYTLPDVAAAALRASFERLLGPYKVYSI